jgi:hypothetical protein
MAGLRVREDRKEFRVHRVIPEFKEFRVLKEFRVIPEFRAISAAWGQPGYREPMVHPALTGLPEFRVPPVMMDRQDRRDLVLPVVLLFFLREAS